MLRIGDGKLVSIWDDPWVVGEEGRFITSPPVHEVSKVSDLIVFSRVEWNTHLISLHERDQQHILAIPLSVRVSQDSLTWAYSKDGLYSTKTMYMLGKRGNLENLHEVWMDIWSMEIPPKAKYYLRRLCSNTLPTRSLLKYRHMLEDESCP